MSDWKYLSHLDGAGDARMVDVSGKRVTARTARATAQVSMSTNTIGMILDRALPKGDVLSVARVAGIMAAKETSRLIPMCHPLAVDYVQIDFGIDDKDSAIIILASVSLSGKTGVEMEALTAAAVSALTIYDMCKAVDKSMEIGGIRVVEKSGGKSDIGHPSSGPISGFEQGIEDEGE